MVNYTWISTSDTDWNTAANWLENVVPDSPLDEVTFDISGGVIGTCNISTTVEIGKVNIITGPGGSPLTLSASASQTLETANIKDSSSQSNTISAVIVLPSDATFEVTNAVTLTMSNNVSGTLRNVNKTGSGTLVFGSSTSFSYSGTTTVTGGILQLNVATSTTSTTISSGATLKISRSGNSTYTNISGGGNVEIAGQIGVVQITFSTGVSYTGTTLISEGSLRLTGSFSSNVTINSGKILFFAHTADTTFANSITGAGIVNVGNSSGITTTLTSSSNTYSGNTQLSQGTLQIGNGITGSVGTGTILFGTNPSSVRTLAFNMNSDILLANSLSFANIGDNINNINILNSNNVTFTTAIASGGTGKITVSSQGTGKLIITNNSSRTGQTLINSGTLQLGNGTSTNGSVGNAQITFANTTTPKSLVYFYNGNKVISNPISFGTVTTDNVNNINILSANTVTLSAATINTAGKMTLNAGTGKLIINASSTRTGPTVINTGTLQINSGVSISSPITINSTGLLQGNGTCSSVTVQSGGTIMAGTSVGTLTVDGDLTLNTGSNTIFELTDNTDLITDRGTKFDAINVINTTTPSTGNLIINSGSKLTMSFFNPSVNFSDIFWNSTMKTWNYIQALGGSGTFDTYDYIFTGLSGPVPGTISNLRNLTNDLDITFTPNSSPIVPCFAFNNINKYSLDDDIIISKQGKSNSDWIYINGLLLTKDHLIKYNDKVMYASEYSSELVNVCDELVDLYSNDGRFVVINNISVATKKI